MAKRARVQTEESSATVVPYLLGEKKATQFVSTGCSLLDCALGGGWAIGRMANIVGDKSTAKTALANEALTNFIRQYPDGAAAYRETEAAYDRDYAASMGLPIDKVDFGDEETPLLTVEDFVRDVDEFLEKQIKAKSPGIYVLDSLDALSDEAEMEAEFGKATYGTAKAKSLSAFFRTRTRKIEQANTALIIVSQVRENIGVMFGEKYRRSGGKALDFYASQILWLAAIKQYNKTINKVERPYGVHIRGKIKKNKVGLQHREVDFPFIYGYGVEDVGAGVVWLKDVGRTEDIGLKPEEVKTYLASIETMQRIEYAKEREMVAAAVKKAWTEVEIGFLPTRRKYE